MLYYCSADLTGLHRSVKCPYTLAKVEELPHAYHHLKVSIVVQPHPDGLAISFPERMYHEGGDLDAVVAVVVHCAMLAVT